MRHIILATICIAAAQTASTSFVYSATLHRIQLAEQNNDKSEMPFLEAAALSEDAKETERMFAARAYIKLATLDEAVEFMRRHFFTEQRLALGGVITMIKFLEKATAEEKDADDTTRENLYVFLLEIVQGSNVVSEAHKADVFLLERVPGYADSKQRASLAQYANAGIERRRAIFDPIKEHFDTLPPSKLVDLRTRFPTLPPPPGETSSPSPRIWPYAATLAALAIAGILILRKVMKRSKETHE